MCLNATTSHPKAPTPSLDSVNVAALVSVSRDQNIHGSAAEAGTPIAAPQGSTTPHSAFGAVSVQPLLTPPPVVVITLGITRLKQPGGMLPITSKTCCNRCNTRKIDNKR